MSSNLKLGLVGCGRAAELIYYPALKKVPNIEIVSVVDPLKDRRELLSKKFNNCKSYNDINSSLIEEIDSAIICTPPDTHVTLAIQLIKNKKYVLIEKPLAPTFDEVKPLIGLDSDLTSLIMMAFNHRYWNPIKKLRDQVSVNSKINSVEIYYSGDYSKWNPVSINSDPLHDLGPHVFDLIQYIFKTQIESVSTLSSQISRVDLKVKIFRDFQISVSIAHSNKTIKSIKVCDDKGKYSVSLGSERIMPESGIKREVLDLKDRISRKILRKTSPIKKTYEVQLQHFFDYIRTWKPASPSLKDGLSAVLAVDAARESISNNGKEIFINEIK